MNDPSPDEIALIDERVSAWRQGDAAFSDDIVFLHVADLRQPLTPQADELASELEPSVHGVATEIEGVVVLTQTCDIVKPCKEWPFVEVCPLVRVDEDHFLEEVRKSRRPSYAWIPSISATRRLVAGLDRVMTVEKVLLASWDRVPGCADDQEAREFADALARKRSRAAFPDDFNEVAQSLQRRIKDKHNKASPEGRMLQALREIRVRAGPSWDAPVVKIFFWFIKNEDPPELRDSWSDQLETWLSLIDWSGRFECDGFVAGTLADLTAQDYVESDRLDLDYLSKGEDARS